jgi:hypothetical protein
VGSFAVAGLGVPPPDTVAEFVTKPGTLFATFTVNEICGYEAPAASTSDRVHGPAGCVQFQPVPDMLVAVRPCGNESVTVTGVPSVGPDPGLETVMR